MEFLTELFSYSFTVRVLIAGPLIALCAALLGVSLVLKRFSMIGDGLSHVGFGALTVAAVMGAAPLAVALPVVIASAFFLLQISQRASLRGDAAIGIFSTTAMAIGVIVAAGSGGMTTDVYGYMFGSILAMSKTDVILSVSLSVVVILCFVFAYNRIFAVTFDNAFAEATGIKTGIYNIILALLTALTIVIGMRIMGTLMISGLIIFPALTAMRVCRSYFSVTICAAVLSVVCFVTGFILSYLLDIPVGASVVAVNAASFLIFSIV